MMNSQRWWPGLSTVVFLVSVTATAAFAAVPTITTQPASLYVALGSHVGFSVEAEGLVPLNYQWQTKDARFYPGSWADIAADDTKYSGTHTAALTVINRDGIYSGSRFRCLVSNVEGTTFSDEATITYFIPPPIIEESPVSHTLMAGTPLNLLAAVTSYVYAATYQWFKNGEPIPGANSSTYKIPVTQLTDAGDYRLAVTNMIGTTDSAIATVRIVAPAAVVAVASAYTHNVFLRTDGTLWGLGYRSLMGPVYGDNNAPIYIANHVTKAAVSYTHTLYLKDDSTLWYVGRVMAEGDAGMALYPAPVQVASGVTDIAADYKTTFFVKTDGSLWSMGYGGYGQLGDGSTAFRATPAQVATGVRRVAAGSSCMFFIKTDDSLWAVGLNQEGTLGDGTETKRILPVQVAESVASVYAASNGSVTAFIKKDATLWVTGGIGLMMPDPSNQSSFVPLQIATDVTVAAPGYQSIHYVTADGTLWARGTNGYGNIGDGTYETRRVPVPIASGVVEVAAGPDNALFVKADGSLWGMGRPGALDGSITPIVENQPTPVLLAPKPWTVPEAPSQVLATLTEDFQGVQLTWVGLSEANDYEIWRSTTGEPTTAVKIGMAGLSPSYRDMTGNAGTVYTYWIKAGNPSGKSGFSEAVAFSVPVRLAQTITFTGPSDQTYTWSQITLSASATSGLSVGFSVVAGPATIRDGNRLELTGIGTVVIQATQAGDASYAAAPSALHTFEVSKTRYTATLDNLWQVYNGTARQVSIVLDGFMPMLIPVNGTTSTVSITYNGSATKPINAGSYAVVAIIEQPTFTVTASDTLVISPAQQTITFNALLDAAYGTPPIPLSATSSSGLPVIFTVVAGPAALSDDKLALTGAGIVTIRAAQPGDVNRAAAPDVDRTFMVTIDLSSWTEMHFSPAELADVDISGSHADPDGDGLVNLMEFALGLDPKTVDATGLPLPSVEGTDWIYTYSRPADRSGIAFEVQISTDLTTWTNEGVIHWKIGAGATEIWRARYPMSAATSLCFRLKVTCSD